MEYALGKSLEEINAKLDWLISKLQEAENKIKKNEKDNKEMQK